MTRALIMVFGVVVLAGCANPIDRVPRLSDVDVADVEPVVEIAAQSIDGDENTGFLQRLMRKRQVDPAAGAQISEGTQESSGAPVLATEITEKTSTEVEKETGGEVAAEIVEIAPETSTKRGIWPFARKSTANSALKPAVNLVVEPAKKISADAPVLAGDAQTETTAKNTAETADIAQATPVIKAAIDPKPVRRMGLFGFGASQKTNAKIAGVNNVREASLAPVENANDGREAKRGLFSPRKARALTGPDAKEIPPGIVLPFGQIARVCDLPKGALGKQIAKYPERSGKYRLFDSAPGNTGLHTFYITGFVDRCPRQFSAALALFGEASMHETLRYGLPDKAKPFSSTDKAYENVKARVCGAGRRKPCGNAMSKLERTTVFLSVYNRFVGGGWSDILLHDGRVVAQDQAGS